MYIGSSILRPYSIKTELAKLLDMKLRDLLSDEEYTGKKAELENERIRLMELQKDAERNFDNVIDKCEQTFDFACTAKTRFENGTPEEKKTILSNSSSNLILKDKKLLIKAQKPFLFIKRGLENPAARKRMFEPPKWGYNKHKNQLDKAGFCVNRGVVNDVRTYYMEKALKYPRR